MENTVALPLTMTSTSDLVLAWEQEVNNLPGVTKLSQFDHKELDSTLRLHQEADSYLTSPTYYLFTGRHGLWRYSSDTGDVLFCWHPNRTGHVIVFPPLSKHEISAVTELFQCLPEPPCGLSIVRVKPQDHSLLAKTLQGSPRPVKHTTVREQVLDWTFPVRILSTDKVKRTSGNKFRNVRKGLIHMRTHDVHIEKLDLCVHAKDVRSLLHRWASLCSESKEEYAELYETYDRLFSLSLDTFRSVEGLVYHVDGNIEAVSLWDISDGIQTTANLFASFCNLTINGLAEYTVVSVCEVLSNKGVGLLNMGGSEIQSLDFFKNKFRPVISIDLLSVEICLGKMLKKTGSTQNQRKDLHAQA